MEGEQELALRLLSFKQGKQAANCLSFQSSVGLSIHNLPNSLDFPLHLYLYPCFFIAHLISDGVYPIRNTQAVLTRF
jgi:hypothetical protein